MQTDKTKCYTQIDPLQHMACKMHLAEYPTPTPIPIPTHTTYIIIFVFMKIIFSFVYPHMQQSHTDGYPSYYSCHQVKLYRQFIIMSQMMAMWHHSELITIPY